MRFVALLASLFLLVTGSCAGIRQRSVESCGPHPLIALAMASRPFGNSASSLNDLIRAVRADPSSWSEMQILLRRYDDCVRAGDGLHYKRAKEVGPPEVGNWPESTGIAIGTGTGFR